MQEDRASRRTSTTCAAVCASRREMSARCGSEHQRALALALEAGDRELEAQAQSGIADALYAQGRMISARAAFQRCVDVCAEEGLAQFALVNRCMIGIIDALLGLPDDGLAVLAEARGVAHALRNRVAETMAYETEGMLLLMCGRYDRARETLPQGLALARETGARRFEAIILSDLAWVSLHDGDREAARRPSAGVVANLLGSRAALLGTDRAGRRRRDGRERRGARPRARGRRAPARRRLHRALPLATSMRRRSTSRSTRTHGRKRSATPAASRRSPGRNRCRIAICWSRAAARLAAAGRGASGSRSVGRLPAQGRRDACRPAGAARSTPRWLR